MGRPIKKRFLGQGDGTLSLGSYRRTGQAATSGGAYVKFQKGSRRYVISADNDAWQETMLLVDKSEGTLGEGEFNLAAINNQGGSALPIKVYNHVVIFNSNGLAKATWTVGASTDLTIVYWDAGITRTLIAFSTSHGLSDGDTITISGSDSGLLDGGPYVVQTEPIEGPDVISIVNPAGVTSANNGAIGTATAPKKLIIGPPLGDR